MQTKVTAPDDVTTPKFLAMIATFSPGRTVTGACERSIEAPAPIVPTAAVTGRTGCQRKARHRKRGGKRLSGLQRQVVTLDGHGQVGERGIIGDDRFPWPPRERNTDRSITVSFLRVDIG